MSPQKSAYIYEGGGRRRWYRSPLGRHTNVFAYRTSSLLAALHNKITSLLILVFIVHECNKHVCVYHWKRLALIKNPLHFVLDVPIGRRNQCSPYSCTKKSTRSSAHQTVDVLNIEKIQSLFRLQRWEKILFKEFLKIVWKGWWSTYTFDILRI